jgi:hypothetical protein
MLQYGLRLTVQILDAVEYFEWLGMRENTYQAQHEYPGGRHVSGDEAMALLGIKSGLFGSGHERSVRARFAAARPSACLGR